MLIKFTHEGKAEYVNVPGDSFIAVGPDGEPYVSDNPAGGVFWPGQEVITNEQVVQDLLQAHAWIAYPPVQGKHMVPVQPTGPTFHGYTVNVDTNTWPDLIHKAKPTQVPHELYNVNLQLSNLRKAVLTYLAYLVAKHPSIKTNGPHPHVKALMEAVHYDPTFTPADSWADLLDEPIDPGWEPDEPPVAFQPTKSTPGEPEACY